MLLRSPGAHQLPHHRIDRESVGVVQIIVARQAAVDRLPQQRRQRVSDVGPGATILQRRAGSCRQREHVIDITVRQQAGVTADRCAAKLKPYRAVKTEL